ncbi:MAG: hypothetical protein FJ077_14400 [Cyanobacteria bacterium K_DeepCast_35m_m2_023]|nr:hypothetical protein [Cyanobacteria bacterium K_DeepCast_35m_m2_023]
MTLRLTLGTLLSAGLVSSLCLQPLQAAPRFGGGFSGGGFRDGGGASRSYQFNNGGFRSGYNGYHPMYGADTRSDWDGDDRINGNFDNDRFNRNVNVDNNFYNRDYNGWNRNWSICGYWGNRPWNTGWYRGWNNLGWWGANAAAWGVASLATGAVIGGLVNDAANSQSPVFMVPNSSYELNYGSVESVGSYGVSFNYLVNGTQLMGAANCQQGLLNGQVPASASHAQLLNAVCQVAYGNGN